MQEHLPPENERRLRRFWKSGAHSKGMGAALAAIDEVLSPGAAKAREQMKGDHERVIPVPSPGDDALKRGAIVIRVPKPDADTPSSDQ